MENIEIKPRVHKPEQTARELSIPYDDPQRMDALFKDFVKIIDASKNTVRTYKISLRQFFRYLKENQIKRPNMDTVISYRESLRAQGKRPTTVKNYLMAVKEFFKWTNERHLYPDIAAGVKSGKVGDGFKKDYFRANQVKKILKSIDRSSLKGKRNFAMLSLMFTCGLRTIEVSRANIEDIKPVGNATVLYVQGKGHVQKDNSVLVPEAVEHAIRTYLTARKAKDTTEPLFASLSHRTKGKRMPTRSIRYIAKTIFREAGFDSPRLTAHSTRHTAATLSLLNGATLEQTQHLLRHKNIQTTEIYAHNIEASKNPAAKDVARALFG